MRTKVLVVGAAREGGVKGYVDLIATHSSPGTVDWHITVPDNKAIGPGRQHSPMTPHVLSGTYSIWSLPIRARQLRILLKQQRFDLLHLHTARAGLLGGLSSVGLPIAIVYTGHGWRSEFGKPGLRKSLFGAIERYICSRADLVTVECRRNRDLGINGGLVAADKLVTIDTRIDVIPYEHTDLAQVSLKRQRLRIPDAARVVGMVGRMEDRKDPATFVRTAAKLMKTIPDTHFLWVGGGFLTERIRKLAVRLGLANRLVITGMRPETELPVLFQIMSVLLFTSRSESLPLTILGANAARRPVVSSAYPGVEEVVEHGRTGYTFPPGDDNEAAHCVSEILRNAEETRRLVDRATERFLEKHSNPQRMAQEYENAYSRAMQSVRRT